MVIILEPNALPTPMDFDVEYTLSNHSDELGLVDVINQFSSMQTKVPAHSSQMIKIAQRLSAPNSLSIQNAGKVALTLARTV
jgi:hypothetical protein